jgi:hypothetical protein
MPTNDVRSYLLKLLATPQAETRFGRPYLPEQTSRATNAPLHEVYAALWGLVADKLVFPDPAGQAYASSMDNWQWRLSDRGVQAATNQSWEPRDPPRYLARLKERAPALDPVALTYVHEALLAFNAQCYLATSVMLGVAGEQVFTRIADAFAAAAGSDGEQLRKLLDNPRSSYFQRFTDFRKRLEPHRADLPEGLADNLTLDAVADLLRVTRNAAGHPTGEAIDEDTAFTHLQMAGRYLAKMTELALHFEREAQAVGEGGAG